MTRTSALVLHHHLGLGDHFICNGLVNSMLDQVDAIYLPAKRQYLDAVRCLYADEPRIEVFPVSDERKDVAAFAKQKGCTILRVGFEKTDRSKFDRSFYRQVGIPFDHRYTKFRLPRTIPNEDDLFERLAPSGPYCLVHREGSHGLFELTIESTLPRIEVTPAVDPFKNILGFRRLICEAAEIHCINSSVLHLVDGISPRARLFYHAVRRTDFLLRPCWTRVNYPHRGGAGVWRRAVARARLIRTRAAR